MKILRFECSSDDTFGEYNYSGEDVDNCASMQPMFCKVITSEGCVNVFAQYSVLNNGCWVIGISPIGEDIRIPDFKYKYSLADNGYSPVLEMEVPDDVELIWYK